MKRFVVLLLVFVIIHSLRSQTPMPYDKMLRVMNLIDLFYVDTFNKEKLSEKVIRETLKYLDPHSGYIPQKDAKGVNETLEGNFEGIGISFNIMDDTLLVVSTIPGGPSEKAGILGGDRIIRVDGGDFAGIGITNNDVQKKLRGEKGTQVVVTVLRRHEGLIDFELTRDKIPIYSVDAAYMADEETGYIRLVRFSKTTVQEFRDACDRMMTENNMKNLILDLSDNGGGLLESAAELSDEFLEQDKMIVYTEGIRTGKSEYKSSNRGIFKTGKLVVIINEHSASASEIVSGAVQDWDRGYIVGRRSFGKGLVQKQFVLPDSSMVRVVTARYYTPSGRCIQTPYKNGYADWEKEHLERYSNGELFHADSIIKHDSLKYYTLVEKREVYGGGGIIPDFFVPVDTSGNSQFNKNIIRKGTLRRFVYSYVDDNRDNLKLKYPDFDLFKKEFVVTDVMLENLEWKAKEEGISKDEEKNTEAENILKIRIKAMIAQDLWSSSELYEIMNTVNPMLIKALEVIKQ